MLDSNTTNVKVKCQYCRHQKIIRLNSNTTNVKVKLVIYSSWKLVAFYSNTTNVKVKCRGNCLFASLYNIQIQPMLRLNRGFCRSGVGNKSIQIQPMLRLNYQATSAPSGPNLYSNTTNVKVKFYIDPEAKEKDYSFKYNQC